MTTDKHKKKALVEATIVMILLIILMFISGMTYLDPPPETGIAVNFGTSSIGKGLVQPQHNTPPKPVKQEQQQQEVVKPEVKDKVLTQDNEDAPVIKDKPHKTKPTPKPVKPKPKPKPKPDKGITDILNNVNSAPGNENNQSTGEGNDQQAGDKGTANGDPNASGYYGNGGHGGGGHGNYRLGSRRALTKPKPDYECNEEGKVVVKIYVNRNGKVINAVPGIKGSTNNAPCLLNAAKQAALNTKWSADSKAPDTQIGKIIYNFKVTE